VIWTPIGRQTPKILGLNFKRIQQADPFPRARLPGFSKTLEKKDHLT
jgi:hypothetical protein